MSVIDIHTHAFPDALAGRAIEQLQAQGPWKAALDGRIDSLLRSMDAAGIDLAVVAAVATRPQPDHAAGILRWCEKIHSDRIEPFPSVHLDTPDAADWPARIAQAGFVGIKLHPLYQGFAADDPRARELCSAAAEENLLVLLHCGRDVAFPPDDDRAAPRRVRALLDALPALRLIATHLGGWRDWAAANEWLVGAPCWLETSFSLADLPRAEALGMIRRHGPDRVMFGTDSPWADQDQELQRLEALGLTESELDLVRYATAADLLGL